MDKYSPQEIEKKWQDKWEANKVYKTEMDAKRPKYYALEMFHIHRAICIWGMSAITQLVM